MLLHNILKVFGNEKKIMEEFFSLSQISGVAPIVKKNKKPSPLHIAQFIINSFLLVKQIGQSV